MAQRSVTITLRDKQTTGGLIPGDAVFGEPFVNLYDGILKFSGVTGGSFEPTTQSGIFEVGSTLYNQKITNRLNINNNFIISGDTGLISTYNGVSGAGLSGKFLSGTTNGFVLGNISDIAAAASGNEGDVQYKSGSGFGAESAFNYNASTDTLIVPNFSAVTVSASSKIYSAGTSLETIIYNIANSTENITSVQPGSNITTGGTASSPIISVVGSPSFNNIIYSGTSTGGNSIATNVSATTFYSAATNLETIIYNIASSTEDVTRVQPGTNITTGGTANNPTVNLVASPSINNLSFSGIATGGAVNATSLSATNLTNTRVLIAGSNGLITDDAGMTYNSATDVLTVNGNLTTNGTQYSGGTIVDDGIFILDAATNVQVDSALLPTAHLTYNLGAIGQRWNRVYARAFHAGVSSTEYGDGYITGDSGTYIINAGNLSVNGNINPSANTTYDLGTSGLRWNNIYTEDLDVSGAINTTGITISGLLAGSVVYAGVGGVLKTEAGFTYDENTDTFNAKYITVGVPGQTGTTVVINGDVQVLGSSISAFTSQLYIEDNLIELNFNPTASTTSTSLGAGWSIQDGSGIAGTDVTWDIRGTSTGLANRSFATNLEDIRIRETGTISSPNGVRVIAEFDVLDGGSY
jgi:hypothetical protein